MASKFFIFIAYIIIRLYFLTFFVKIENEKKWLDEIKKNSILVCSFHQNILLLLKSFIKYTRYNICSLVSQSRDGQIATYMAKLSRSSVVQGSSSKGGKKAMEGMIEFLLNQKGIGVNFVDGPQGPLGVVKPGSIKIAQKAKVFIIPVFFELEKYWQLNSWDNFLIPKPFSTAKLKFGKLINVDKIRYNKDFEEKRLELETYMACHLIKK